MVLYTTECCVLCIIGYLAWETYTFGVFAKYLAAFEARTL